MRWGVEGFGKSRFSRWENGLLDAYCGPDDDLCDEVCARCGSDALLHRPVGLVVDGVWVGEVVCEGCVPVGGDA